MRNRLPYRIRPAGSAFVICRNRCGRTVVIKGKERKRTSCIVGNECHLPLYTDMTGIGAPGPLRVEQLQPSVASVQFQRIYRRILFRHFAYGIYGVSIFGKCQK